MACQPQNQLQELIFSKGKKLDGKRLCITASLPRPVNHMVSKPYRHARSHALGQGLGDSPELAQISLREGQLCSHLLCQAAQHSYAWETWESKGYMGKWEFPEENHTPGPEYLSTGSISLLGGGWQ